VVTFITLEFPVDATLSTPFTASSTVNSTSGSSTGSSALLLAFIPSLRTERAEAKRELWLRKNVLQCTQARPPWKQVIWRL
jgi:hypothetical protein